LSGETLSIKLIGIEFDDGIRRFEYRLGLVSWAPLSCFLDTKWLIRPLWDLHVLNIGAILALFELLPVQLVILMLKFAHFLYFVEIYNEARLIVVEVLDTFSAEN